MAPGQFDASYYNMISKLLAVQARRKSPWLLFLTTRVGKAHVHQKTLDSLCSLYGVNLANCAPFQKASSGTFKIGDPSSLQKARQNEKGIQSVFLIGLCKWLLSLAIDQSPPSVMEVKSVLGYRVVEVAEAEDMVSIAIRFDPTHEPVRDNSNLASIQPKKPDECDLATKALKKVGGLRRGRIFGVPKDNTR
jgi:hypothetical protein